MLKVELTRIEPKRNKGALSGLYFIICVFLAVGITERVHAAGQVFRPFTQAIESALTHDPQYLLALAAREAKIEEKSKARSGLLPNVAYTYSKANSATEQSAQAAFGAAVVPVNTFRYDAISAALTLRQPLYRLKNWYGYLQSHSIVTSADLEIEAKLQHLYVRVLSALIDIGVARVNITHADRALDAAVNVYEQKRRLELAGEATSLDRMSAYVEIGRLSADVGEARRNLVVAERAATNVIGEVAAFALPNDLSGSLLKLELPALAQLLAWQRDENPELRSKREMARAATLDVRKAMADHSPTLDLVASTSQSLSGQDVAVGRRINTSQIGIQLTIPIYSGGGIQAGVRQAEANRRSTDQELRALENSLALDLERNFYRAQSQLEKARAIKDQLELVSVIKRAAEEGFIAGERTRVEVIQAYVRQAASERDLSISVGEFLKAYAQIWVGVGRFDVERVAQIEVALFANLK